MKKKGKKKIKKGKSETITEKMPDEEIIVTRERRSSSLQDDFFRVDRIVILQS